MAEPTAAIKHGSFLLDEQPQVNRTGAPRLAGLDVTRAVALIGVVVMNYHGYLNGGDDGIDRSFAERVFDIYDGPLTTRFAAVFVLVAGMGVTLMTNRSRRSGDAAAISEDRWRLVRRGLLLYACGTVVEWVWPGTILFFYGAFFIIAAALFTLRTRWLVVVSAIATGAGAGIAWFRADRLVEGDSTTWLDPRPDSPRNLLLRTFVGYTHPLFPWLAFLCAGIAIGRLLPLTAARARLIGAIGAGLLIVTYAVNFVGQRWVDDGEDTYVWRTILSTSPWHRGVLYTLNTLGSAVLAFVVVNAIADRTAHTAPIRWLRHAGQMTLTLYVGHVLLFNAVVNWWQLVGPTGLDTALALSVGYWAIAITFGAWWHRYLGTGPLEGLYRRFGG